VGNYKKVTAGDTSFERFANSNLDTDTQRQLEPYRARLFY
jgi:hypothetical protein